MHAMFVHIDNIDIMHTRALSYALTDLHPKNLRTCLKFFGCKRTCFWDNGHNNEQLIILTVTSKRAARMDIIMDNTHNTMLNVDVASVVHAMVMVKITAKVQIGISLWPGIDILHD